MKQSYNNIDTYDEETTIKHIPNDGIESIDIEPINWDDM